MCSERLTAGEAPACVQACPHEAIAIRVVDRQSVIDDAETAHFLPAAPDPQITLPTTHFKTSRVFPRNTLPADYAAVNPQHPHWPLIIMLVLTQLSVGAFVVGMLLEQSIPPAGLEQFRVLHAGSTLAFGLVALAASTLHLGRPQYAFRAVIGLRHSWLSREIVAFGLFAVAACAYAAACLLMPRSPALWWLSRLVALTGIAGVFCSAMIYVFTRREFWSFGRTAMRFVLSAAVLGIAATWLSILAFELFVDTSSGGRMSQQTGGGLVQALIAASACKLLFDAALLRHLGSRRASSLKRSAQLLVGPLASTSLARFSAGLLGGIMMPLFLWNELASGDSHGVLLVMTVGVTFAACLTGELLERYQFFAACAVPRIPGQIP
jgi:formate dehydrogenase iron-sulfur subunit